MFRQSGRSVGHWSSCACVVLVALGWWTATGAQARSFDREALYGLVVAELALRRNQYDLALEHYLEQARRTRDPGVVAQAARLADYLDREAEAREMASLWVETEPENADALRFAAMQQIKSGELEAALEHLGELRRLQGSAAFGILARQAEDLDTRERKRLLAGIDRLLVKHPDDPALTFAKALLLLQDDLRERALPLLAQAFGAGRSLSVGFAYARALQSGGDLDAALGVLETMRAWEGGSVRVSFTMGRMLLDGGRLERARRVFEELLAARPQNTNVHLSLAYLAMQQKRFEVARDHLEYVLAHGPQTSLAHYYLGRVAEEQGDLEDAVLHYDAVDGENELLAAQERLVRILAGENRMSEARARLAELRGRQRADPVALYVVEGELLLEAKQPGAALALAERALERYPDNISLLYARAMAREKLDDLPGLERDLHRILELEPDNAVALNALGYTLADRTDRYQEAYGLISRALKLKPTDAAYIDSMGWVQYRLMNYDEALRLLRQAHRDMPDHEVAAHLGEVLWVTGSRGEALKVWREALERDPASEVLKHAMERFRHSGE